MCCSFNKNLKVARAEVCISVNVDVIVFLFSDIVLYGLIVFNWWSDINFLLWFLILLLVYRFI